MTFKEWLKLQEVGTSTASVATFAMPLFGGPFVRTAPEMIGGRPIKKHKRKRKH